MKHLVIIPTYNEVQTVEKIISEILDNYNELNILIVDDSSPDGTQDLIKELQKKYDRLHLITQDKKYGLKKAYMKGINWGLDNNFDVFTTCDADFSHNPKYFKDIINYLNEDYEVIIGSRYIKNGATTEKNWFRNLISIGGNIYTRLVLGNQIYDWTGGFNTYTKSALDKIQLEKIKTTGYITNAAIKHKALKTNCKIKEFPIIFVPREIGNSKMSYAIIIEAFVQVFKIRLGL